MSSPLVNWGVGEPARALRQPTGGFDAVYQDLRAPMLRIAFLATGSTAIAEEIVQEAFLRLHRHFDDVDNPGGFLRTAVVRLCSTWRDRRDAELRLLPQVDTPPPLGEPELDTMWELLARLRPERRLVLVLRFYEDMTPRDIAQALGCPAATVRTRVRRGLIDLRRELER
jgi:RNA polymerase sigma factor (sigma-70 family)